MKAMKKMVEMEKGEKEHSKEAMSGLKDFASKMLYGKKKKVPKKVKKFIKEEETEEED